MSRELNSRLRKLEAVHPTTEPWTIIRRIIEPVRDAMGNVLGRRVVGERVRTPDGKITYSEISGEVEI